MTNLSNRQWVLLGTLATAFIAVGAPYAEEIQQKRTSYAPVDLKEDFSAVMSRMKAAKPEIMKRQMDLLRERYDLANRPAKDVTMSRGKPIQEGIRVKIPQGMTW
jgi:hypothetical protein